MPPFPNLLAFFVLALFSLQISAQSLYLLGDLMPGQALLVEDILPGPLNGGPDLLSVLNGEWYFRANSAGGYDDPLWKTNGAPGGAHLVDDDFKAVEKLVEVDGLIYALGHDADHGTELWRTDGTPAGTQLVQDLNPGPASASPENLKTIGEKLFFSAHVPILGREPWVYAPDWVVGAPEPVVVPPDFWVTPNPVANHRLGFRRAAGGLPVDHLEVIDAAGRSVLKRSLNWSEDREGIEISTPVWPPGLYTAVLSEKKAAG